MIFSKPQPHKDSLLTVLWQVEDYERPCGRKASQFLCQCRCKKTLKVQRAKIQNGHVKSCGCLRSQKARERGKRTICIAQAAKIEHAKQRKEQHAPTK